jgi:hypothetical protein
MTNPTRSSVKLLLILQITLQAVKNRILIRDEVPDPSAQIITDDGLSFESIASDPRLRYPSEFLLGAEKSQGPAPAYECLNGKNPINMSKKDILKEFARGKCSPMVIVPGLLSTKLIARIKSCQKLQDLYPELFKLCGWNACEKKWDEFWKKVPDSEYTLWIPDIFSPLSIMDINSSSNFCFAKFFKQTIDFTKPIEDAYISNDAYEVGLYGNSPKTEKYFGCGDGSVVDLMPLYYQTKETKTFAFLFKRMRDMGYVAGLTYQTLPYDYTKSYRNNELNKVFQTNLTRLKQLTGKKVTILAHSLGNLNTLFQLSKMDFALKRSLVKNWIAVMPPFLGSPKVQKILFSGDDDFIFLYSLIGLHVKAAIEGMNNVQVIYELSYHDAFTLYKSEKWFEAVRNRTAYEHSKLDYENSGFSFLPKIEEECSPRNFIFFPSDCKIGLSDTSKKPTLIVMQDEYKLNDFYEAMGKWNLTENTQQFLNFTFDAEYLKLHNPEVPVVLISMRTSNTIKKLNYTDNITNYVQKGVYYEPQITWGYGDNTVPTNSAFIPPLKWAWEFENKAAPNAQPVKIVDACSVRDVKTNVYDVTDESKEYQITSNGFVGMNCECRDMKTSDPCSHAAILTDKYFIEMVTNIAVTNEIVTDPAHDAFVDSLDDGYLEEIVHICPQIKF